MEPETAADEQRSKRRLATELKASMRELAVQLSLLNHQVSSQIKLQDIDLDCLDIIGREGPLTPGALARQAGLHPATMTGILDRLERAGWIKRERVPTDRRAVHVSAVAGRGGEIFGLYAGMNTAMDEICGDYDEAQLALVADFIRRTAEAGRTATDALADR